MSLPRFLTASIAICLGTASLSAADPTSQALIEQLKKAATKAAQDAKEKGGNNPTERPAEIAPYLSQLTAQLRLAQERGDAGAVQQAVAQLRAMLASEEIDKISDALIDQLQKEIVAKEQAYIASVDAAVESAVAASFTATEAKELDGAIIELSKAALRENYNSSFEPSRRSAEKARAATTFLCRWQDYLLQTKSGNTEAASAVLKSLSQDTSAYPFVPRSQILERIALVTPSPGKDATALPEIPSLKNKTLADIETLKDSVREALYRTPSSQPLRQFSEQLNALDRAYEQLHAGLVGQAFGYCTNQSGGNGGEEFLPLRQSLLLEVLPVYLNVAETYPPKPEELPTEYLLRIIAEARAKGNWVTVWKTLEAYRAVAFSGQTPSWLGADIQGVSQFIVAQNLEKAGQWVDAIRAYKRVIALPGENLPIKEATERITALQKEQPEAFESASKPAEPQVPRPYPVPGNPASFR